MTEVLPVGRRRGEQCPSALRLEQWLAGELPAADGEELEAHVGGCARCQREHAERLETRRLFAEQAPPFAELSRRPRARRGPWLAAAATLAAAAAGLLLVGAPWREDPASPGDAGARRGGAETGTRTKGRAASFGWVVRRGERVFAPGPDERLRAGDALRFTVSAREPVFVAIIGLDPQGQPSVYHPDAEHLSALGPGRDQPLPVAIQLGVEPGGERVYGVFCREPLAVAALRDAIARSPDAPLLPAGCEHERRSWRVEAP